MNSSGLSDSFTDAFIKNFITFTLGIIINCINGAFVYTYFRSQEFQRDPRYILYIHLVINDMIVLTFSVVMHIVNYSTRVSFTSCCIMLIIGVATNKNTPLNLAGMVVERYIAICRPLHHVQICTVQRAHAFIALIWGMSLVPALTDAFIIFATQPLSVFSQRLVCHPSFIYTTPYHTVHHIFVQALHLSLVSLILIVSYLRVLCTAQAVSGSNQASARNARNTILLHGIQLLICMVSYLSPFINLMLIASFPRESASLLIGIFILTNVLPRLLSPLIYGVRDKKFRCHIQLYFFRRSVSSTRKKKDIRVEAGRRSRKVLHLRT